MIFDLNINLSDQFTADLLAQHPEDFNTAANNYLFKTYLFKSRANNLRVEDMEKSLNTPNKIVSITNVLNIPVRW